MKSPEYMLGFLVGHWFILLSNGDRIVIVHRDTILYHRTTCLADSDDAIYSASVVESVVVDCF